MTRRITSRRGTWPRAGLLALMAALVPLPAAAGPGGTQQKVPTLSASLEQIVARDIASGASSSAAASSFARSARRAQTAGSSTGFFKSRPGVVALVVMAAGTGYALYSATHDRIHSAGKQ